LIGNSIKYINRKYNKKVVINITKNLSVKNPSNPKLLYPKIKERGTEKNEVLII